MNDLKEEAIMYEEKYLEALYILKKLHEIKKFTHEDFESTLEKETNEVNNNSQLYAIPEDEKINIVEELKTFKKQISSNTNEYTQVTS